MTLHAIITFQKTENLVQYFRFLEPLLVYHRICHLIQRIQNQADPPMFNRVIHNLLGGDGSTVAQALDLLFQRDTNVGRPGLYPPLPADNQARLTIENCGLTCFAAKNGTQVASESRFPGPRIFGHTESRTGTGPFWSPLEQPPILFNRHRFTGEFFFFRRQQRLVIVRGPAGFFAFAAVDNFGVSSNRQTWFHKPFQTFGFLFLFPVGGTSLAILP